jgi:hypothetical protein
MSDTSTAEAPRRFGVARPKVPAFARYKGTSAWRKNRRRAHAYALFLAAAKSADQGRTTPSV